jgi:hypothetical protein
LSSARKCAGLLAVLIWTGSPPFAEVIDINVSGEAVRLTYIAEFEARGLDLDFGWLHNEDDGDVGAVGLQVVDIGGEATGPWSVGLGGQLFYVTTDADDGSGLGLGGHAGYRPRRLQRFEVAAYVFYAPSVISFGDVEEYLDAGLTAGFWVMPRGKIYLGAREVRVDFEERSSVTIDHGLHAGLRIRF